MSGGEERLRDLNTSIVPFDDRESLMQRGLALADELTASHKPDRIRILVVDDIPATRFNLAKLLSFEPDMEVIAHAGDGREAIRVTWDEHPDLILMDICMPGMDGITATEHLSATCPSIPVIMMSVQGDRDYLRRAMLAGAHEYLVKPFSADELVNAIRNTFQLAKIRSRRQTRSASSEAASTSVIPPLNPVSHDYPCNLLPIDASMPSGFQLWEGAGPMDAYLHPHTKYCNRVFTSGPRPSTSDSVIWTEVYVSASAEIAASVFDRRVSEVQSEWDYNAPLASVAPAQPEPWSHASRFSAIRERSIVIGEQSRVFEAVMYGRFIVWAYVRKRNVVWGVRSYDVEAQTAISLVDEMTRG